jgi:2-dehydro-3-deoxyphosphogalactonate aldolase
MPLLAILRGVAPGEVLSVAAALQDCGFLCLEIPLNSPDPLQSIGSLRRRFGAALLIGAGTVLTEAEVVQVHEAGADFVVSPNTNAAVIRVTKQRGLLSLPGFATPTEAFAALEAGADALKLFPAESAPPPTLRALKAVLPSHARVLPVGGISPAAMPAYVSAGAAGFGIGSAIFKPGLQAAAVRERAAGFVEAWRAIRRSC